MREEHHRPAARRGGGVAQETDEYFCRHVGDDPTQYDYAEVLLPAARRWNRQRFYRAVDRGVTPVVVDRGNGLNVETLHYARYAVGRGYRVELKEPESPWWQEIRVLLKYRHVTREILYQWADALAARSRSTHRVPAARIREWMDAWKCDQTVEQILDHAAPGNRDDGKARRTETSIL